MRLFVAVNEDGYVASTLVSERPPGDGRQLPSNVIEMTGQDALFRQIAERPGYKREKGEWVEPPAPAPVLTLREFMRLFARDEVLAISQARPSDPDIEYFWTLLMLGQTVELGHRDTVAGVGMLVAKGLLAADRQAAILANQPPPAVRA